jgi:SAM-dependent methyltransferase
MNRLMQARALVAALDAAEAHGLLGALAERPAAAGELAGELGLDAVACTRVLEVLRTNGLLDREGGVGTVYSVPAEVRRELAGPDANWPERARFWTQATSFLATGDPFVPDADRPAAYHAATPHLARMTEPQAAALADRLAERMAGRAGVEVLDVGAGAGVWSLALLERLPTARATAVDFEPVLPRYRQRAAALGLEARVHCVAGDYERADTGEPRDVALLANVLHLECAARARRLLARWADAVAPGGLLVIVDVLSRAGDEPGYAAYALHLGMRVRGAFPHHEPELRAWLAAAGFPTIERLALVAGAPFGALIAERV